MTNTIQIDISLSMMVPDLLLRHPQARRVLDRYGLHGCGGANGPVESLGFFARAHGVEENRLVAEIRAAISGKFEAVEEEDAADRLEDTLYRRYFTAGIISVLTAGAVWGAWLLWKIGFAGKFTGVSIHEVNAHGHAQIFGWVGLFVMGFGYQAFPRLWHTRLWRPGLAVVALGMMVIGLIVRTIGMTAAGQNWAMPVSLVGGLLEIGSVVLFAEQILVTFAASKARWEPYVGFVVAGIAFLVIQAVVCVWHTWRTMTAATRDDLLWQVATWQAPLRDLQIHGLAMLLIVGVNLRMLPAFFEVPKISARRSWWSLGILVSAVLLEVAIFAGYRFSGSHAVAALLMIPWVMLVVGVWMAVGQWKLWKPLRSAEGSVDRIAKFIRTAYLWLATSFVMLLLMPVYQSISGIAFSHAYYGAIRHAITVGFVSMMIMAFAAKVVPTLNGVDPRKLTPLWGPFVLINIGCTWRCFTQVMTDANPWFFKIVGVSGMLEVTALAWWGIGLIGIMRVGKRASVGDSARRPALVAANHKVADVLAWWPQTEAVFIRFGFTEITNRLLRRTVARTVSLANVCAMRGVDLAALVRELNACVTPCSAASQVEQPVELRVRRQTSSV